MLWWAYITCNLMPMQVKRGMGLQYILSSYSGLGLFRAGAIPFPIKARYDKAGAGRNSPTALTYA